MQKYLPDKNFNNFPPTGKVFSEQEEKALISQWSLKLSGYSTSLYIEIKGHLYSFTQKKIY